MNALLWQFFDIYSKLWTLNDDGKSTEKPSTHYVTTFGKGCENDTNPQSHKIGIWITAIFLLGEMAGGGVVQMPYAMMQAGNG